MERISRKQQHLGTSCANPRPGSPQSLPSQTPTGTYKNNPSTSLKNHPLTLDLTRFKISTLFNFLHLHPNIPSFYITRHCPSPDKFTNDYKKLDDPWTRYPESHQELVNSARYPLPPSPSQPIASPHYHLCPSCSSSPLSTNSTLYNRSYYTPYIMSDASVNLSVESPMDDVIAWDTTPALPVPQHLLPVAPRQDLSGEALHSVALAPPISP
jgi:hypothetical protein